MSQLQLDDIWGEALFIEKRACDGAKSMRWTLMLAWHSVRADADASSLLGISPGVAGTLASFSLTELDRIAERRYRYVRPRWKDRPIVWRHLLLSASTADARQMRDTHLRALQLLTGELISARLGGV